MKKFARQIAPKYQEPHLFHVDRNGEFTWDDDYYANVAIFADHYYGFVPDAVRAVYDVLESGDLADVLSACADDHEKRDAVTEYLPRQIDDPYTQSDILSLCRYAQQYGYNLTKDLHLLCYALTVVTGKHYVWRTIHGTCQGECANVVYPEDEYSRQCIDILESEYFNQGSEWIIYDPSPLDPETPSDPDSIEGYSVYVHAWRDSDILSELAYAADCMPSELTAYKFDGYTMKPKYALV